MSSEITVLALVVAAGLLVALALAFRRMQALERQVAAATAPRYAEAERALQQQEAVLKAVDEAVLVLDLQQIVMTANPAAEALFGLAPAGETLIQVVDSPALVELVEAARLVRGEGMERRIEFGPRILHARAVALPGGEDSRVALALRDVTEMQRLERARRELVSNVSHELSTPITAIGLLADTLLDIADREKPKRLRKMVGDIKREVDTLTQLVQEMRDLSLIESGQMPVRLTPTPLLETVQASVKPLEALAESKQQTIDVTVPDDLIVLADSFQLQRALKNILHNAVKYAPERGEIEISATRSADEAIISVRDDGPGIAREDLPRIFERFYQADRARRSGTGLGLAIVRHIVLAHGGRVWAESVEGEGATFFLTLALAHPDRDQPAA
ncbi:MAG: PAS domain-containing protein [Anaerolineae bacterium]|nr:PAS domain-containing protein [Anaerolineae bacterium]